MKRPGWIIVNKSASHFRFWNGKTFKTQRHESKVIFQRAALMRHLTKASAAEPHSTIEGLTYEGLEEFLKVIPVEHIVEPELKPGPRLITIRTDNKQVYDLVVDLLNEENIESVTQEWRWDAARYNALMDLLEK